MGNKKVSEYDGAIDKISIQELYDFYRKHLLTEVMGFWKNRTMDKEYGGYIHGFDRMGNIISTEKNIWVQARQIYIFSSIYHTIEKDEGWLRLAKCGRDFITKYAYAGNGRWNYMLSRNGGMVTKGTISIFTDLFVLAALSQYSLVTKSDCDLELINKTYDSIEKNIYDSLFKDISPNIWNAQYERHAPYMICLNAAGVAEQLLGVRRTRPLIDYCLEKILYFFAKDDHQLLFETVARDGSFVDTPEGRMINPGHSFESMWFCMEEGKKRNDASIIQRSMQIADWMYNRAYDREYGGFYYMLDAGEFKPVFKDWNPKRNITWDDKVDWVHAEALYLLALMAFEQKDHIHFKRFIDLHQWCQKNFPDVEYGEWYPIIGREGNLKLTDKGGNNRCAFHVPRSLMSVLKLLEDELKN